MKSQSKTVLITTIVAIVLTAQICAGILIYRFWWPVYDDVPLSYTSAGAPVIEVMIGGQGPFRVLIDTGFSGNVCLLRSDLIEELQLDKKEASPPVSAFHWSSENAITFPLYGPTALSIGAFRDSNLYCIEQPNSQVDRYIVKSGLDGIMGMGIFENRKLCVALDFEAHRFRFASSAKKLDLPNVDMAETIYLEPGASALQHLGVRVHVSEMVLDALIDTGSSFGLGLPLDYQAELSLPAEEFVGTSGNITGIMKSVYSKLNGDFTMGSLTISNPEIKFNDTSSRTANVGMKILREFAMIAFDYRHEQIYFKPRSEGLKSNEK